VSTNLEHEPLKPERTRTSAAMVWTVVAVIFLVLLIVFIAQNNRKVPLHFFWASGNVSEALAIVGSAVAGAFMVLAIGLARILQLRVGTRRHNREMAKQAKRDAKAGRSAPPTSQGEAKPVQPED
jgi:uncharacterized integral membrane protein